MRACLHKVCARSPARVCVCDFYMEQLLSAVWCCFCIAIFLLGFGVSVNFALKYAQSSCGENEIAKDRLHLHRKHGAR